MRADKHKETKLTEKEHWDSVWSRNSSASTRKSNVNAPKGKVRRLIKRIAGKKLLDYRHSYTNHLVWDVIYPQEIPQMEGLRIVEIGSAPGMNLVRFNNEYGYEPYGVEYSDTGVELNRRVFAENGINPDNVIHADFFSQDFADKYRGFFDIVYSLSFVEHFANAEDAVNRHVDLLKESGTAIIILPNLRGVNYLLALFFRRDWKQMHNFDIMDKRKFAVMAEQAGLSTLHCDYFGVFDFTLFQARPGSPLRFIIRLGRALQPILNIMLRTLFPRKSPECRYLSPYLIYIGRKQNTLKSALHT